MAKHKGTKALTSTVNKAGGKDKVDYQKAFTELFDESTLVVSRVEILLSNYSGANDPGDLLRDLSGAILRDASVSLDRIWEKATGDRPKKPMDAVLSQAESRKVTRFTADCEGNSHGVHAAAFADLYDEIRLILWRLEQFLTVYTLDDIWRYGTHDFPDLARVITRDARVQLSALWDRAKRGVEAASSGDLDVFVGTEYANARYEALEAQA